jgi:DNA-directed RNA polymerase subunit RPC12/RpoP
MSYSDNYFVNSSVAGNKLVTTTIRDSQREIYRKSAESVILAILQQPKEGASPSPHTAYSCPHCGAPSTLEKLTTGCEFCGTKFLMDELYPKVMYWSIKEGYSSDSEMKLFLKCMVVTVAFILILGIASELRLGKTVSIMDIIGLLFGGALLSVGTWLFVKIFSTIFQIKKDFRGAGKTASSLRFCRKMRTLDPTFSNEFFRDKSLSLLKLMLYSQNPQELTVCQCDNPIPEKLREIVDTTYHNSGVDNYRIKDGVCDVSLTFYMDSLHYHGGKIRKKSDKIRMSLRKVIKKPTDLGFSISAVSCPSCGASFDAAKVKACPYCGNAYPIEENDWVVTDIWL